MADESELFLDILSRRSELVRSEIEQLKTDNPALYRLVDLFAQLTQAVIADGFTPILNDLVKNVELRLLALEATGKLHNKQDHVDHKKLDADLIALSRRVAGLETKIREIAADVARIRKNGGT